MKDGWYQPADSNTAHYFDTFRKALCSNNIVLAEDHPEDEHDHPTECGWCRIALDRMAERMKAVLYATGH